MKRLWSCFMFLVWTQSLEDRRRALWKQEAWEEAGYAKPEDVRRAERRVNRALVAHTKWKKRACENCRTRVARSGL